MEHHTALKITSRRVGEVVQCRSGEQARSVVYWKPVDCVLSLRDKEVAAVRDYL